MNTSDYTIRPEKKEDRRAVENLIRRSVKKMCRWHIFSVGRSGCAARREVTATRRLSHKRAGTLTAPTRLRHCGFDYARNFGIRYHDLPEGADDSFFLCRELIPGYLNGVTGVYETPKGYYALDADVEEFDKSFPPKEKLKLPGQLFG